jgi:hypothetical protein
LMSWDSSLSPNSMIFRRTGSRCRVLQNATDINQSAMSP